MSACWYLQRQCSIILQATCYNTATLSQTSNYEHDKAIEDSTSSAIDSFECECKPGFSGDTCEITPCSDADLCKNGGICTLNVDEYECLCTPGYYGKHCEKRPCDEDLTYPDGTPAYPDGICNSHGTCQNLPTLKSCSTGNSFHPCVAGTDYKCDCDEG